MIIWFRNVLTHRHILRSMVVKDLKDKYVDSVLGIIWALINPVLTILAISFVFTKVLKTDISHYPLMVLSGLLPWIFFVGSICESATSMKKNTGMLSQFVFPRDMIPASVVLSNFTIFLLGLAIMLPVFIAFNVTIVKYLFLVPLIMFLHLVFTLGTSILFSVAGIYFKDLPHLLNIVLMFLFWMTPIFYPMEMIPENYRWIVSFNPGACYVIIYRSLLYDGSTGRLYMWCLSAGFALVSLIAGYLLFAKKGSDILKHI
jgi:ABC-type polysaccharide/polyol phosphate export permease